MTGLKAGLTTKLLLSCPSALMQRSFPGALWGVLVGHCERGGAESVHPLEVTHDQLPQSLQRRREGLH